MAKCSMICRLSKPEAKRRNLMMAMRMKKKKMWKWRGRKKSVPRMMIVTREKIRAMDFVKCVKNISRIMLVNASVS